MKPVYVLVCRQPRGTGCHHVITRFMDDGVQLRVVPVRWTRSEEGLASARACAAALKTGTGYDYDVVVADEANVLCVQEGGAEHRADQDGGALVEYTVTHRVGAARPRGESS